MRVLIFALLLSVTQILVAQTTECATLRVIESTKAQLCHMTLTYEDGRSEIIPLRYWQPFGNSDTTKKVLIQNQLKMTKVISRMRNEGYEVKQLSTTGENIIHTYVLFERIKEE